MRQHQSCRSRAHDADLRSHGSSRLCRENARGQRLVQGMEAGNLGPFAARRNNLRPHACRCRPRAPRPMLGDKSKNTIRSWGDRNAPHSAARGLPSLHSPSCRSTAAPAQTVALSGQVTSAEEGAMEGVLVSAKKAGSTITITVVSDRDGRYSFPASKLEPGQYALRIRAVGYDLDNRQEHRSRGAENRHARSQAPQDRGPRRATVERRMDRQHSRHRSSRRASCSTASAATRSSASCARRTTPTIS